MMNETERCMGRKKKAAKMCPLIHHNSDLTKRIINPYALLRGASTCMIQHRHLETQTPAGGLMQLMSTVLWSSGPLAFLLLPKVTPVNS